MNGRTRNMIARGIPEDDFLRVCDSTVWIRRSALHGNYDSGLPNDVTGWPKSGRIEHLADHLNVTERAFGKSFRPNRGGKYFTEWASEDDLEVPVEAFLGHLLARALIITRLARFLRGVRRIELRTEAKAKLIREALNKLEEEATAHRKRLGPVSTDPSRRLITRLRRSRLSVLQARKLASAEPGRLYVVRAEADGTTTVVGITFRGEHRYGSWKVRSGEFDSQMVIVRGGETSEVGLLPDDIEHLRYRLSAASLWIAPYSIQSLTEDVERIQKDALATEFARSQVSDQELARFDQVRASLSQLAETQRRLDQCRKRRLARRTEVIDHYRRWIGKSARHLFKVGVPVESLSKSG